MISNDIYLGRRTGNLYLRVWGFGSISYPKLAWSWKDADTFMRNSVQDGGSLGPLIQLISVTALEYGLVGTSNFKADTRGRPSARILENKLIICRQRRNGFLLGEVEH